MAAHPICSRVRRFCYVPDMMLGNRLGRPAFAGSMSVAAAAVLLAGCGETVIMDMTPASDDMAMMPPADMARLPDLTVPPDLAMADMAVMPPDLVMMDLTIPPDFSIVDFTIPPDFAPPSDFTIPPDLIPPPDLYGVDLNPGRQPYKYVWNKAFLPSQKADYSFDLNGDGIVDNALGDLVVNLKLFGVDMQAYVDDGVMTGADIKLVRMDTEDPIFLKDPMPFVYLRQGMSRPNPDYTGNGNFAADNNFNQASYQGFLMNQRYFAYSPSSQMFPTNVTIKFTLFGQNPTSINLQGSHIQYDTGFDPRSGAPGLLNGQLQGSIRIGEVKNVIVKDILGAFNLQIMMNGPGSMLIQQTFDVGNCNNQNGQIARAADKFIDECELTTSMLFMTLLAPDVTIYDGMGMYRPDPNNGAPDSFSVGIGFTAVKANFN